MSKKTIALLFILIITPAIIYLLWPSDESRIKKLFKEGSHAIEREDLETVMSKVSFNYRDEYGFTYLYLKELMKTVFKQMNDIKCRTFTNIADIGFVCHTEDQDFAAINCLPFVVQRGYYFVDDVFGQEAIDFRSQLDEARRIVEGS